MWLAAAERDEEGGRRGAGGDGEEGREGGREVKIAHPFVYNSTCRARTHMQTQRHSAAAPLLC